MYVPSSVKAFGSADKMFRIQTTNKIRRYTKYLEIRRTHRKYLNSHLEPCTEEFKHPDMTACVAKYVEGQIGCRANIQGAKSAGKPDCNSTKQLGKYSAISQELQDADPTFIYGMTGCLSGRKSNDGLRKDLWLHTEAPQK